MAGDTVKVLFIGGYGRSGSTLLDRMLGQTEGFQSIGELRHIFREGYIENRRCGCGERFLACPFWSQVTERAFRGMPRLDPDDVYALQRDVDRWWRIPQLATGAGSRRKAGELARYREVLRRLYVAVAEVSGARVIVDSSKDVSHGWVLRGIGEPIDPYVAHLVRDSRAVAHSWRRRKFNPGNDAEMQRYSLLRTCAEWSAINFLTGLHRHFDSERYRLLRYGELVGSPRPTIEAALEFVGERGSATSFRTDDTVELASDHTVAGNPGRFQTGTVTVRPDEEWRTRMPAAARAAVTALTLPALVKYR